MRRMKKRQNEDFLAFSAGEKMLILAKSSFAVLMINYFFYRSVWAVPFLLLPGAIYFHMEKEALLAKKRGRAREQFQELMLLVSTGQKAGYSAENAFLSSYRDMEILYGRDSSICRMLDILKVGKENHADFSKLWYQIGDRVGIPEIQEFAVVYEISCKSSGNAAAIMEKTADIIIQKLDTEKEIEVIISARKLEQKIMNIMPFLIMFYISITSPGYFDGLYHSALGAVIMTICLSMYLAAYLLSRRIADIKV